MSDDEHNLDPETGPSEGVSASADEKKVMGVPYDWSRPTATRIKSRLYNSEDPRLFPPKAFGVGWTINFYWFVHPARFLSRRRYDQR